MIQHYAVYLKTLTYCVMHMVVAVMVAYGLSGSWAVALSIGLIEPLVQTGFFHLHERVWAKALISQPVSISRRLIS